MIDYITILLILYCIILFFIFVYIIYLCIIIEIESNRTIDIINRSIQISRETNRTVNSLIMLYQINNNSQDFKQHHELQKKINNQIKSKYIIVINPDNNYDIGNEI